MVQVCHLKMMQSICFQTQLNLFKSWRIREVVEVQCVQEGGKCGVGVGGLVYENVEKCDTKTTRRERQAVVADLDGAITRARSPFPYFMLVAFEAGSPLRGLILVLMWPLIWLVHMLVSEAASICMLIFISTIGLKEEELEGVGRAVLCRFYLEDMHPQSFRVFVACGKRCVVTCTPRLMVEPFLKDYLGVERVLGTEVHTYKGFCTGFLKGPGVLVGKKKRDALRRAFPHALLDVGLASLPADSAFLSLCKEGYMVTNKQVNPVPKEEYMKPLIFHDGRLAIRPTPITALFIYLWFPIGLTLSITRILIWTLLPSEISTPLGALLGVKVRIKGCPPLPKEESDGACKGVLYVCTHRTLLDPIFLSIALRRKLAAVTYSLSRLSEILSPIRTIRLTRNRVMDARIIESELKQGDLVICPEGTTCREPYLLRFSPLFAEITNDIVPVAMQARMSLFHGTTVRGFKGMDPFYFLMNPRPSYTMTLLEPFPKEETCASGKPSLQVANHLQQLMALVIGYNCTSLTRKDKYLTLAGHDGTYNGPTQINFSNSPFNKGLLWSFLCDYLHSLRSSKPNRSFL